MTQDLVWTPLLAGESEGWAGMWMSSLWSVDHSAVMLVFQLLPGRMVGRIPWLVESMICHVNYRLMTYLTDSGLMLPSPSQRMPPPATSQYDQLWRCLSASSNTNLHSVLPEKYCSLYQSIWWTDCRYRIAQIDERGKEDIVRQRQRDPISTICYTM